MNENKVKNPFQGEFPEKDANLKAGSLPRFTMPRESPGTGSFMGTDHRQIKERKWRRKTGK
ncbi:hypothetical protein [Marinobacter sp. ATCH36]|uniref:hypothetical protein n=1 Tax=Marinobacter sp. ATCH36 TaxID=2945106 RepID=UPI00201FD923|nr:hypothetical protein [Marinobacter sp. ATCH36]MCL7946198.1 hypothetical protein [Marinobacter sp. ATCH36]